MFQLTQTFSHTKGFCITPFHMENVGLIFIPKEIENQLGYEKLSDMIRQSDSFSEGIEYLNLEQNKLLQIKSLLNRRDTIPSVQKSLYEFLKHSRALIVLTEAGLYTVMILSRKPNAQTFRRWITCEVLPSIREKGLYKLPQQHHLTPDISELSVKMDAVQKTLAEQHNTIKNLSKIVFNQQQFQQFIFQILERMETTLSEALPHDMFEGWKKIKSIVADMEKLYSLSEKEIKEYIEKLCYDHDIDLPEISLSTEEIPLYSLKEIAQKIGVYSTTGKPHFKLISALIQHLDLKQGQEGKYSSQTLETIRLWFKKKSYPQNIKLRKNTKIHSFKARYNNDLK